MRHEIIRTKIKEIEESLLLIKNHLPKEFDEFKKLGLIKDGIYKRIEFAIENIFDICAIINTDLNLGVPSSEEDIIENLIENKIIDKKFKEKLKAMKGFRNILVHRYGKIDDKLVFDILTNNLGDFYEFIRLINEFLIKNQ
ncbi:MAG: type VII toxin-antitoxin system HepT family RNase toxin [Candidatus Odinarchaeia archaeon]